MSLPSASQCTHPEPPEPRQEHRRNASMSPGLVLEVLEDKEMLGGSVPPENGDVGILKSEPGPDAVNKKGLDQIVRLFFNKAALVIFDSRLSSNQISVSPRWGTDTSFQLELDSIGALYEKLKSWNFRDALDSLPPSMIIETYVDIALFRNSQRLAILDQSGSRWDVMNTSTRPPSFNQSFESPITRQMEVVLERWKVQLSQRDVSTSTEFEITPSALYKNCVILFRSLYATTRLLPTWRFLQLHPEHGPFQFKCRVLKGSEFRPSSTDALSVRMNDSEGPVTTNFSFGKVDTAAGSLMVEVEYRIDCNFQIYELSPDQQVQDAEERLGSEVGVLPFWRTVLHSSDSTDDLMRIGTTEKHQISSPTELIQHVDMNGGASTTRAAVHTSAHKYYRLGPEENEPPSLFKLHGLRDNSARAPENMYSSQLSRLQTSKRKHSDAFSPDASHDPEDESLPPIADDFWRHGGPRRSSVRSNVSHRSGSLLTLWGIPVAPKEFTPSELPSLRHKYSDPDLRNGEWTEIKSSKGSSTSKGDTFGGLDKQASLFSYQLDPLADKLNTGSSGSYKCTYHSCALRFETPAKLQQHKRQVHRSDLGQFQCDYCTEEKTFPGESALFQHITKVHLPPPRRSRQRRQSPSTDPVLSRVSTSTLVEPAFEVPDEASLSTATDPERRLDPSSSKSSEPI